MAAKRVGKPGVKAAKPGNHAVPDVSEHPSQSRERAGEFLIAFGGQVELINARWDLESGRTVDFRIAGDGYDRIHPFKKFQRKRSGRMGSRFAAAIATEHGELMLNVEVMLKGWTESATGGQQFSLWLDNEASLHPFAGHRHRKREEPGEMFVVKMIEINDDETPVQQEGQVRTRTVSQQAHLLVTGGMFVRYLKETKSHVRSDWDGQISKLYVKHKLNIESLGDLDKLPHKAREYREEILKPFERWQGGH